MKTISLVFTLVTASIVYQMSATMLNPILSTLSIQLNASPDIIAKTHALFFVFAAVWSIIMLRLSDYIGRKRTLLIILLLTLMSSIVIAMSKNLTLFLIARMCQAISGALLPLTLLILYQSLDNLKKFSRYMGILIGANIGITAFDLWVHLPMAEFYHFSIVFYFIASISILAILLTLKYVPELKPDSQIKIDWFGLSLIALSALMLLMTTYEMSKLNFTNLITAIISFAIAILLFIFFYYHCQRAKNPFFMPEELKSRALWCLLLTTVLSMTGMFAIVRDVLSTYAKDMYVGFGLDDMTASYIFTSLFATSGLLGGCFIGHFAFRYGYLRVLRFGLSSSILLLLLLISYGLHWLSLTITIMLLLGITYAAAINIILNALSILLASKNSLGILAGMNSAAFHLGAGLSITLLPAIQCMTTPRGGTSFYFYFNGVAVGIVVMIIALMFSFFIPEYNEKLSK